MKNCLVNIIILLAATLSMVVAVEIGTRAYSAWVDRQEVVGASLDKKLFKLIKGKKISPKTFNIYYFGGSTMKGSYKASIPKLVEALLGDQLDGKDIRSINVAAAGEDFEYNLRRLRRIIANKNVFHPTVCVIYSGHNEYLAFHEQFDHPWVPDWLSRNSHLVKKVLSAFQYHKLEIDERKYFDEPLFEHEKYDDVISGYCSKLEEAVGILRDNGVPVVISTVAGNYTDWEPNRSVYRGKETDKHRFKQLMENGKQDEIKGDSQAAIKKYQDALRLSEFFAETHFRLGKVYQTLGHDDMAWDEFLKAIKYDGMPIRALASQNDFIRKLAIKKGVGIADAVELLREHASQRLIGFNLMFDGHHPTLEGYILISELIAKKILDIFPKRVTRLNHIDEERARSLLGMDSSVLNGIWVTRGHWVVLSSTWRYKFHERLKLAEEFYYRALAMDKTLDQAYWGLAMVSYLRKDVAEAEKHRAIAKKINAEKVEKKLKKPWIQKIIQRALSSSS